MDKKNIVERIDNLMDDISKIEKRKITFEIYIDLLKTLDFNNDVESQIRKKLHEELEAYNTSEGDQLQ